MEIFLTAIGLLGAWGVVASIRGLAHDGYHRIPIDPTRERSRHSRGDR
ncbi:MAG: hypothetical protein JWQ43_1911 [Glaciihabitans sp.]|nr:hypothetical protein [Glaciihabitans sp.]